MEQRTKAESDLAVAAASILAREAFIDWLERTGKDARGEAGAGCFGGGERDGAGNGGSKRARTHCEQVAKVHFRTAHEIAPEHFAAPPPRREWRK